jgi:hypothetical protein
MEKLDHKVFKVHKEQLVYVEVLAQKVNKAQQAKVAKEAIQAHKVQKVTKEQLVILGQKVKRTSTTALSTPARTVARVPTKSAFTSVYVLLDMKAPTVRMMWMNADLHPVKMVDGVPMAKTSTRALVYPVPLVLTVRSELHLLSVLRNQQH